MAAGDLDDSFQENPRSEEKTLKIKIILV